MRILILNRRDIANPSGGGAEAYTHEIARGLVDKYQCTVVVLASRFKGSAAEENIDGIRYIRKGNEVTVHLRGFLYALKNRKKFDRIIDEFNGIGFFTFFLPNSILLIHQLYKEFWLRELGLPGILPFILEPMLLWLYRKKESITVSPSTKEDLEHMGFRDVNIVMNATKHTPLDASVKKNNDPTLVFLGRLKSTKRPQDAIEIFKRVKEKIPTARLWMIGRGPEEEKLKIIAKGIEGITFWGWVDEEKKMLLLRQSHLLLVPSVREGFGINVIEAASTGTPAIGYDVHGLRDSIRHGETGYLVNSTDEAALRISELLRDKKRYEKMSNNCLYYSKEFDWDKRVDEFWHKGCLNA
jgi:glycosyltransferase involved in cell wall biosynthesis